VRYARSSPVVLLACRLARETTHGRTMAIGSSACVSDEVTVGGGGSDVLHAIDVE